MKEDILKQLIERTFANIACPLNGNGLYAELQKAISEAYNIGIEKLTAIPIQETANTN